MLFFSRIVNARKRQRRSQRSAGRQRAYAQRRVGSRLMANGAEALESRAMLTVFTVTTDVDEDFGAADLVAAGSDGLGLSLREAIRLANDNGNGANQGQDDGDRVVFDADLAGSTIALSDRLQITDDVQLDGGAGTMDARITLRGSGSSEVIDIDTVDGPGDVKSVVLRNLNVNGGRGTNGGGIANRSGTDLTIENCEIYGNRADVGGGVFSRTPLTITHSIIRDNQADSSAGGIYVSDPLTITDTRVNQNVAALFGGGILVDDADADITASIIRNNRAEEGGGVWFSNETLRITDSLFELNGADIRGGGVLVSSPTTAGEVFVDGSTFRYNSAGNAGGAIYSATNLTVSNHTTIEHNSADIGGGIVLATTSPVQRDGFIMTNSVVKNNTAEFTGGGLEIRAPMQIVNSTLSGNSAGTAGGAIVNVNTETLGAPPLSSIVSSTINNNTAGTNGGGIRAVDFPLDIINSTISGNMAGADGGGIGYNPLDHIFYTTTLRIISSTIVENSAVGSGGGVHNFEPELFDEPVTVRNSIIADNMASNGPDASGLIGTVIQSLIEDPTGIVFTSLPQDVAFNVPPMLGPLEDNGGPTFTHELLPGSIAIDHGSNVDAPDYDQTGAQRVVDGDGNGVATIDMGAYEFQNRPPRVLQSLDGLFFNEDAAVQRFDLNDYFSDPNYGDTLSYAINFSNNPALLSASIDGSDLVLNFKPNKSGDVRINITATDSGGAQISDSPTFHVLPVNDPIHIAAPDVAATDEDTPLVFSSAGGNAISLSDVDIGNGQVELTIREVGGRVTLGDLTGIQGNREEDGSLVAVGNFSDVIHALDGLTFTPDENFNGAGAIELRVKDVYTGAHDPDGMDTHTVDIEVRPLNDAPVNTVPGEQTGYEDVPLLISGISVFDVDADEGTGKLQVTLSVDHGTLDVDDAVPGGLTAGDIGGNGTATVTLDGTAASINATLAAAGGLVYLGDVDFYGTDTFTVVTNDLGNLGAPGPLSDSDSVPLRIYSTTEQIAELRESIDAMASDGVLKRGQARSMSIKLALADAALDREWPRLATLFLDAVLFQVNVLQRVHALGDEQAAALIESIDNIHDGISIRVGYDDQVNGHHGPTHRMRHQPLRNSGAMNLRRDR